MYLDLDNWLKGSVEFMHAVQRIPALSLFLQIWKSQNVCGKHMMDSSRMWISCKNKI